MGLIWGLLIVSKAKFKCWLLHCWSNPFIIINKLHICIFLICWDKLNSMLRKRLVSSKNHVHSPGFSFVLSPGWSKSKKDVFWITAKLPSHGRGKKRGFSSLAGVSYKNYVNKWENFFLKKTHFLHSSRRNKDMQEHISLCCCQIVDIYHHN